MFDFSNKNILVLGGMGFIGSNLAHRLVRLGARVTLVDSMLTKYGGNLENIESIRADVKMNFSDIRDKHSLKYLVRDQDVIYSVAGQTSHIESMTDPYTDLEINCASQLSILECCRQENPSVRLVYASTRQIYGKPQYLPVDENHPVVPVDVNGINKLAAEMYYALYTKVYGMKCVSLRLTNTYGPRQHLSGDTQGFCGIFLRRAMSGEKIRIFGNGEQLRDFNYVDDVVEAFLLATRIDDLNYGVYNLGASERYSLLEFTRLLHRLCPFEWELVPFPAGHKVIDIGDYYADYTRFEKETGWAPKISLEEGLERTVSYFTPRKHKYWSAS